jgi:pimeloyl-ACP methyl ester carboxylesterase
MVETLKVPGARLHYEVRGSGPVMLAIPGGACDVGLLGGLAALLADRYTVVTCDPRGNSRSPLDGPGEDQRVAVHADDARRLLAAVAGEPAFVFGNSGGALVGLELVARHPERVRRLVAHEPPCASLLPDAGRHQAFSQELHDLNRTAGTGQAVARFLAGTGYASEGDGEPEPPGPPPPELRETFERTDRNWPFFFEHVARPWTAHEPDVAALRAVSERVVMAAGAESAPDQMPNRAARALAGRLGLDVVELPGGHGGPWTCAGPFAEALDRALRGR